MSFAKQVDCIFPPTFGMMSTPRGYAQLQPNSLRQSLYEVEYLKNCLKQIEWHSHLLIKKNLINGNKAMNYGKVIAYSYAGFHMLEIHVYNVWYRFCSSHVKYMILSVTFGGRPCI